MLPLLTEVKKIYGEDIFKEAMKSTTDDIKVNRVAFDKKTSNAEFLVILLANLKTI